MNIEWKQVSDFFQKFPYIWGFLNGILFIFLLQKMLKKPIKIVGNFIGEYFNLQSNIKEIQGRINEIDDLEESLEALKGQVDEIDNIKNEFAELKVDFTNLVSLIEKSINEKKLNIRE
ncbi:MAG: hypothetical protein ACK481_00890 [Candidatus Melainabacteria bacterium]